MRLIALLNFYAERPDWLHDTVISLPLAGVDQVVASDGAYKLYPDGKPSSGLESHDALRRATDLAGIPLHLHVPETVWDGNELEKRTHMFWLGERFDPDWWLIIDADERIIRCPADLKDRLAGTDRDYADVMSLEQPASVVHSMAEGADWPQVHFSHHVKPRRCLIRAVPGTVVAGRHNDYVTPDGRNLWGDEMGTPLRVRDMMIDHRNGHRSPERRQAALDYYAARTATGAEPGLTATPRASEGKVAALNAKLGRAIGNWTAAA